MLLCDGARHRYHALPRVFASPAAAAADLPTGLTAGHGLDARTAEYIASTRININVRHVRRQDAGVPERP
jgi:hypothetical protein